MIPQTPPSIPGVEFASVYVPCFTLGGDFYDFIPLPYDNVGLAVADVSGKGVPASLIMASVRAFLRAAVDNVYYLYDVMQRINEMLYRDTQPNEFCTLFYGVLDARNRRFTYCNAGHPPGLVLRNGEVTELQSDNMVIGISLEERYTQSVFELQTGDMLLLYTDGRHRRDEFPPGTIRKTATLRSLQTRRRQRGSRGAEYPLGASQVRRHQQTNGRRDDDRGEGIVNTNVARATTSPWILRQNTGW